MKTLLNCSTRFPKDIPHTARTVSQVTHSGTTVDMDKQSYSKDANQIHIRAPDPDHEMYFASLITLIR